MPKVRLTREQIDFIYKAYIAGIPSTLLEKVNEITVDDSQIIHEPTNVEMWDKVISKHLGVFSKLNLAKLLSDLNYDATPAYNEVMKDGK